jgi:RNA polymerase sigma-70 factor (ECF subfamily)
MKTTMLGVLRFFAPRLPALEPAGAPISGSLDDAGLQDGAPGSGRSGRRTEGGDPEDLHNLVVEHGDAIYRLALSVVKDKPLAEDIAQETLVKAWLALPSFRGDASLRSWVLRIAHNTAISTIRQRRAIVIDPYEIPEEETRPERSVESRVQSDAVMNDFVGALDTLDDLSRSIVVLRELEGMAYDEIAEVLDVPLPTVKTRLLRARRKLGSALREWS